MTKTIPANQLWFINTLVTVRVSISDGQDGISVLEHRAPYGFSPPLHLHRTEDEVFHVLEGEFRLKLQDQERRVGPGDILLAPKGVPHTYRLESAQCLPEKPHGRWTLGQPFSTTARQRARARLLFCSSRCLAGELSFSRSTPFRFCLL
jgi:quercetin dioxygenase-like cupin family protein